MTIKEVVKNFNIPTTDRIVIVEENSNGVTAIFEFRDIKSLNMNDYGVLFNKTFTSLEIINWTAIFKIKKN